MKNFKSLSPQPKPAATDDSILTWGENTNISLWSKFHSQAAAELFAEQSNIFETGVAWGRSLLTVDEYAPQEAQDAQGNDMPPLTAAEMRKQREYGNKNHTKLLLEDKSNQTKLFGYIMKHQSPESKLRIEHHEKYKDARAAFSLQVMYTILVETHLTKFGGDNEALIDENRRQKERRYRALRQRDGETVLAFHIRFRDTLATSIACGGREVTDKEQVLDFLRGLSVAHETFKLNMKNDAMKGT